MYRMHYFAAVTLAIAAGLFSVPARAQTRVFVSTSGSDSNACTVSSPCRSFAQAFSVAATNAEIDVLTPGGYGGLTITHGISIQGHGYAGVSVSSGTGIAIDASSTDDVNLNGLLIDGGNAGRDGIYFSNGKSLTIENCVVRNMTDSGLLFVSAVSTPQTLAVSNSYINDSQNIGIDLVTQSSGAISTSIDRTVFNGNAFGLYVDGSAGTGSLSVAVTDTVAANNSVDGFFVKSGSGQSITNLSLTHSLAEGNGTGVEAMGTNATLSLAQSTVTGNGAGFNVSGGVINSYDDNYVDASNGTSTGSLTLVGKQ